MINARLSALRNQMKKFKIDAYFVPGTDAHQSEYLPDHWKRREWLSGFTGSAGDIVVTISKAGLWTDSRYFLQAAKELQGSEIILFKSSLPDTPSILEFISQELKPGQSIGIDPALISYKESKNFEQSLMQKDIFVKWIDTNLIDLIWEDQPQPLCSQAFILEDKYAGESVSDKLSKIRKHMKNTGAKVHILTALDAIAWTFNLRAADIKYNPYLIAYAIITKKRAYLYANKKSVSNKLQKTLEDSIKFRKYESFNKDIKKIVKRHERVWLDDQTVNRLVVELLPKKAKVIYKQSPVTLMKALKNGTQIKGFRVCHIRDGAAMVKFLCWLENAVHNGGVTEISAAQRLEQFREEQKLYQGLSFETISAYGAHGAIVHYSSLPETDVELKPEGIYLLDSGAHYLDGTTDITRTIALGSPTKEQKDRFTRVLKGHITLAMAQFPAGTQGIQLDTLARKPLWDIGLNYGHGTGHGIGAFLGVHEGPQGISYYRGIGVALEPGMVCSNEPGFYKEGEYGIRIENLVIVHKTGDGSGFLNFETITLCPIDNRLIEIALLSDDEITWLNNYHRQVYDSLSEYLDANEAKWLKNATKPLK